jgi:hypothetical protein
MTSVELSFWVLGILAFFVALYGMKRYRTPLNPLTIFAITQIGLFTILSGIVAISMTPTIAYTPADIVETILISVVYLGATVLPYLFHGSLLSKWFGKGLSLFGLSSGAIAIRFNSIKFALLLAGAAGAFVALALFGGGGILWLTNTREAYISYRAGAGPFFALTQWLLTFAMLYYIWTTKPRALKLLLILFFFCAAMYPLGSKNNILTLLVIGVAYYNFYVKRISLLGFIVLVFLMVLAVLSLLLVQGAYPSLLEGVLYFRDYFDTTAQFISRFDEFGFRYGQGWLSSLWFYVPRGLYPDKPYEYGFTLFHQVLFPGAAAKGHTPGLLTWSLAYLDFGVFGVFVYGLLVGIWQRMAYEYFLKHRHKFFAFVLAMQFSIWPIWTFAPLVFIIILSVGQSIFLRLVWRRMATSYLEMGNEQARAV